MIMNFKAILFGSIGTLIETSEFQRRAFNQAFSEGGLDWNWKPEEYRDLLSNSGGYARIKNFAIACGVDIDSKHLYEQKTKIFDSFMATENIELRPGVANLIRHAKDNNLEIAFVTSTTEANINAVFLAIKDQIKRSDFSFIGNDKMVSKLKPNPDIYLKALSELNLDAKDCIAIEDTEISMKSALAASIQCIAFPGEFAQDNNFTGAAHLTENLNIDILTNL